MKPWHLKRSVDVVENGGVLAYPTEAVYGLGCLPLCEPAVARILDLKRRSLNKGLILVGADISQFEGWIDFNWLPQKQAILASWPGPVTWILPVKPAVPRWLTGNKPGLAVRVSAHPIVQQLCTYLGPLVSTSANPAGSEPAKDAARVRVYFGNSVDFILPGAVGQLAAPTEIRHALSGEVLRSAG